MKPAPLTLFWRLVAGMSLVALAAVLTSGVFLYLRFDATNSRFREETLLTFAKGIAREAPVGKGSSAQQRKFVANRLADLHGEFAVVTDSGAVLAASDGIDAPLVPPDEAAKRYFVLPQHDNVAALYGLSLRIPGRSPPTYVQVAFPRGNLVFDSVLEEFIRDIAWIWIPFVLAILVTNVAVAELALRPLRRAVREAEEIGPASISMRLSEGNMPPDVLAIVQAVNRALNRLQAGYLTLERFTADVAHELRTPLAIIKARLSLSDEPVAREFEGDFDSMERLVNQMVDRVRLGGLHFEPEDSVDLCEVARQVCTFLAPVIIEKGRLIEVLTPDQPVRVSGARDYIFRALRNLVENAVEHSPLSATVTVEVREQGEIMVLDRGPGYPSSKLEPAARRDDRIRSGRPDGLGLGLIIVEETMTAHGGSLILENRPKGGAAATMHFPRRAA